MYIIAKKFKFDAAHRLEGLPQGHKCGNLHGHTYSVEVALQSKVLSSEGWVIDFTDLKFVKQYIDDTLDHKFLNDALPFQTTSENLAQHFYNLVNEWLHENGHLNVWVKYTRVSETEATYAEYRL